MTTPTIPPALANRRARVVAEIAEYKAQQEHHDEHIARIGHNRHAAQRELAAIDAAIEAFGAVSTPAQATRALPQLPAYFLGCG